MHAIESWMLTNQRRRGLMVKALEQSKFIKEKNHDAHEMIFTFEAPDHFFYQLCVHGELTSALKHLWGLMIHES